MKILLKLSWLTCKVIQGHFEMVFSAIRSRSRFNNNPTLTQFGRLLLHAKVTISVNANCVQAVNTSVLKITNTGRHSVDNLLQPVADNGDGAEDDELMTRIGHIVSIYH